MDKDSLSLRSNLTSNANAIHTNGRETTGTDGTSLLRPAGSETITQTTSSEFVLQWGNRKRLRCMKVQVKDNDPTAPAQRTTVRVDRRVVRADKDSLSQPGGGNHGNGYLNLRQRHPSPQPPPPPPPSQRILRNSEASGAMRGQSNGVARGIASPDRGGAHDKRGNQANNHSINLHHHHHHHNNHNENNKSAASSETAHDSKKGGGSSSGSGEAIPPVWPPKFVIALTNKEKEEDFMAIKGSKLPQRPKKRAKFIQRTLNLVSPGAWLCDLTLERYEVREKKISKKRPRGLKAMGNMDSDSE